ncbi:hypothetical protein TNCV_739441 [Trichonephila clavipes]|nr:hypothetical protein TNCV_739441 [Trichonephila clavipes]
MNRNLTLPVPMAANNIGLTQGRKPKQWCNRQTGGNRAMVWEACKHNGLRDLQRISGRIDSAQYQAVLYDHLVPLRTLFIEVYWIVQKDIFPELHLNPPKKGFKMSLFCHGTRAKA